MTTRAPALDGYEYVRELGQGGYATVYLYRMARPAMDVAVKVLNAEALGGAQRDQFTAEANAMAQLAHHPHIVPVFRADVTSDGRPYIVMKYYPRPNFALRARSERLSVPEVLRTGIQIASAVETAHRAGILHRDIKPANILADQYGYPGLTDFGIATGGADDASAADGMSVPWAPPEVIFGPEPVDRRADVYSIGASLWHLLVGRSPFEVPGGDNAQAAMMRRIQMQPPPPTGRADVPQSFERLLQLTMAKQPSGRPATALELARSLQALEQEHRLPLTSLVLADDGPVAPVRPASADDTRVRAVSVDAQASLISRVPATGGDPFTAPAPPPTRKRRPNEAPPALDGTVRRPASVAVAATESPPTVARRPLLLAVGGLVATLAALSVYLVTRVGGSAGSPSTPIVQSTGQDPLGNAPPGTPVVRASRADGLVSFTWGDYTNAATTDLFEVAVDGGRSKEVSAHTFDVPSDSARVCLQIVVRAANGVVSDPGRACG